MATTRRRPPAEESKPDGHFTTAETALWAGACAFFGNLIGLKVLESISGEDIAQIAGAILVSLIAAGAVYSKERLTAARSKPPPEVSQEATYREAQKP